MKRLTALAATVVLALALVGCGDKDGADQGSTSGAPTGSTSSSAPGETPPPVAEGGPEDTYTAFRDAVAASGDAALEDVLTTDYTSDMGSDVADVGVDGVHDGLNQLLDDGTIKLPAEPDVVAVGGADILAAFKDRSPEDAAGLTPAVVESNLIGDRDGVDEVALAVIYDGDTSAGEKRDLLVVLVQQQGTWRVSGLIT